jgi:hypothetical protein
MLTAAAAAKIDRCDRISPSTKKPRPFATRLAIWILREPIRSTSCPPTQAPTREPRPYTPWTQPASGLEKPSFVVR